MIVVISSGGDGHTGAGASRITRDVTDTVAQVPEVIEALTGISLIDLLKNLPAVQANKPSDGDRVPAPATDETPPAAG